MIWNFLWPTMLVFSVAILPMLLWRRMKSVQQAARDALDEAPVVRHGDHWEEVEVGDDGFGAGRAASYNGLLTAADRDRNDGGDNAILGDRR